ncbi:malonyl-CoA decarboxylase domain-containing protein [Vibrio sp. RC27]
MPNWTNMIGDLVVRVTEIGSTMISNNVELPLADKCEQLLNNTGEATSLALSREILDNYQSLTDEEKLVFFQALFSDFGVDVVALEAAFAKWRETAGNREARSIHFASEPRSQELIRILNRAPGGTAALVSMREDLIRLSKQEPNLASLDHDLNHLFNSWFNRGFLSMEVINWSTPAVILEKIISYEAVHEIKGWDDLRLRVAEQDRRLYGFFHASMRSEPLIFVEVALTTHTPITIESILSGDRDILEPNEATTAVFYSISNCQAGLRGISFGNFLIKQVVEELKRELPNLKRFITMSPVPGLRKWIATNPELDEASTTLVQSLTDSNTLFDEEFKAQNSSQLNRLACQYLLDAKHKNGGPFDPVSRFHLGNGAHLEQINLWANSSSKGISDSWGLMVNYEYDLKSIERNHEEFLSEGKINTSAAIKKFHKKSIG